MPVAQPPQPPRTDSWRFTPGKASDNERPATCPPQAQKNHLLAQVVFCVGENLFFRAVSSQVSSAPASLTSVFGMGTGGPSRQSTPTIQFAASLDSFNIIPQPFENCKPFFKIFRKNFAAKAAGMEKRLYKIVLNRASATRGFLKLTKSRAHLSYTPSQSPRTDSWRFTPGKASDNERPATCPPQAQKNHLLAQVVFCVGENLFFRAVSSQVSSAPASLTSVFGMGTGGPSRQSTPTMQLYRHS